MSWWSVLRAIPSALKLIRELAEIGTDPVIEIDRIRRTDQRIAEMRRRSDEAMRRKHGA